MQINVTSNLSTIAKAIDAFGKDQIPFATARALNDTAKDVRANTINRVWRNDVNVRNKNFMNITIN